MNLNCMRFGCNTTGNWTLEFSGRNVCIYFFHHNVPHYSPDGCLSFHQIKAVFTLQPFFIVKHNYVYYRPVLSVHTCTRYSENDFIVDTVCKLIYFHLSLPNTSL